MYYIIGAFFVSLFMSSIILPNILFISCKKGLFDKPDARKIHTTPVPRLGGLSFFPVILIVTVGTEIIRSLQEKRAVNYARKFGTHSFRRIFVWVVRSFIWLE